MVGRNQALEWRVHALGLKGGRPHDRRLRGVEHDDVGVTADRDLALAAPESNARGRRRAAWSGQIREIDLSACEQMQH
jgi:hypothetical protein